MSKSRTMLDARRPTIAKTAEARSRRQFGDPGPAPTPGPNATSRIKTRKRSPVDAGASTPMAVVRIAELAAVATAGHLITYALGSCVGVVGYDEQSRVAGLLHVLLPHSESDPERAALRPGTYADTGIPALVQAMQQLGANPQTSRFRLAGGASMLRSSATLEVGQRNVMAVRKALGRAGLQIQSEAVGGTQPRTVSVNSSTGVVVIASPGRPEVFL